MPGFVFTDYQLHTLLSLSGVQPLKGSPLRSLRDYPRSSVPGEPDFDQLVDLGLVSAVDATWRVNSVLVGALHAIAEPDEVIDLAVSEPTIPGLSVARKGSLVVECTVGFGGDATKVYFPLTRTAVFARVMDAFSGDRPLGDRVGFRFVGTADEVFVLSASLRRLRQDFTPCTIADLLYVVQHDATQAAFVIPFASLVGPGIIETLAGDPDRVRNAIEGLIRDGHLVMHGEHVLASTAASTVLDSGLGASCGISRTEFVDGVAKKALMQVFRCGEYLLTFRILTPAGESPRFEWAEVDRVQLRLLIAAFLLTTEELALLTESSDGSAPSIAEAPSMPPTIAPPPSVVPTVTPPTSAWSPTHMIPATGALAYDSPDSSMPVAATLDPLLLVQVDQSWGDWAHVICSNGWGAWVDGRTLTPR